MLQFQEISQVILHRVFNLYFSSQLLSRVQSFSFTCYLTPSSADIDSNRRRVEFQNLPQGNVLWIHFALGLVRPIVMAAFQLSAGKEVALRGSAQFALYWAEVKPP